MFKSLLPVLVLVSIAGNAAPLSFERDVKPVLMENCAQCHGQHKFQKNITEYSTAVEMRQQLLKVMEGKTMPWGSRMKDKDRQIIIDWLNSDMNK